MKLMVNFDLLSKIVTSKTGLALDRTAKAVARNILIVQGILLPFELVSNFTPEQFLGQLLRSIAIQVTLFGIGDIFLLKLSKEVAIQQLKYLMHTLKNININTDYDLLIEAYKYRTDYKVEFNDSKLPQIKQEKYIMLPVYENGEEKEVSILQEHIIGSKNYELSIGEPMEQKQLKLVSDPI